MVEDTEKIKDWERYVDRGIERKDGREKIKKRKKKRRKRRSYIREINKK